MGNGIQSVRGMDDLFGEKARLWFFVESKMRQVFSAYGYDEIRTPLVEYETLFKRGVGETSDIVQKEMYSFLESDAEGAAKVVLRPEGTAPVVRALVEHKSYQQLPVKWFYVGPMYRKERPQKGRYRQFHQYGFEVFGEKGAGLDAETLLLVQTLLESCGLNTFEIQLNTLGDLEDRLRYKTALLDYFSKHESSLSPLSQSRMHKNPLRIFDSKDEGDQSICNSAPLLKDYIGPEAKAHWEKTLQGCQELGIRYKLNHKLVRGLDYYCRTVFEVTDTSGKLGAQNALGGGGRYDGLVSELGGPEMPAIGFAGGFERLLLSLPESIIEKQSAENRFDLGIIDPGENEHRLAAQIVKHLRSKQLKVDWDPEAGKSFKNLIKRADRMKVKKSLILGSQEIESGLLKVKDMGSGQETNVTLAKPLNQISIEELSQEICKIL